MFVLNASVNWCRTPDLLKLFGYVKHATCPLCKHPQCTLHHILVNCNKALYGKRYTWRHDSVLRCLEDKLRPHVEAANTSSKPKPTLHISKSFHRAGETSSCRPTRKRSSQLTGPTDWKIQVDYDGKLTPFPPEIYSTPQRPDIVIWSVSRKRVILIELTCPAEEGIEAAHIRKDARYLNLAGLCRDCGWSPTTFSVEVGARGFVGHSLRRCLSALGVTQTGELYKSVSMVAAKCSLAILQSHTNPAWDTQRALLTPDSWQPRSLLYIRPKSGGRAPGAAAPGPPPLREPCREHKPTPRSPPPPAGHIIYDSGDEKEEGPVSPVSSEDEI
jgi:hypothetical protein